MSARTSVDELRSKPLAVAGGQRVTIAGVGPFNTSGTAAQRLAAANAALTAALQPALAIPLPVGAQVSRDDDNGALVVVFPGDEQFDRFVVGQLTAQTWIQPPLNRRGFHCVASLLRTAVISRGRDTVGVAPLPPSSRSDAFTANTIENLIYPTSGLRDDGGVVTTRTFCEMLRLSSTDGIVVLADGRLVYERYFGAFTANDLHVQFSNTKTCLSLIAAHLVASGQLDLRRRVCDYIPELPASSGFGEALVEHVLDMTTTIVYEEKYNLAPSEFLRNIEAAGYLGDNFSSLFEVRRRVAPSVTPRS